MIIATMEPKDRDFPSSAKSDDINSYMLNEKEKCLSWKSFMFKLCCGLSSMLLGMFRCRM